jgi:flavin reductase (DIM6/NTAB) family NADH-FMN oxidoreductase RutF
MALELRMSELAKQERYKLMVGLVVPRPIAWISTQNEDGVANCAPFSFFNAFSEEPPLCIVSFNLRRDGQMKHTLRNIRRTGEFVVNLADEETANAMHLSSNEYDEDESEFAKAGLTPVPARLISHPRILEAVASLECKVERHIDFGPDRALVIGEVLLVHARDGIVDPKSKRISEANYHPVGRMFATRYCTTRQRFDLPGVLPDR